MGEKRAFLRDFSIYGIGGVLTKFVGLLTAPVYTRVLEAEGYGLLELVYSISTILMILVSLEMHTGYGRSYYASKDAGEVRELRGSVTLFYVVVCGLLLAGFHLLFEPLDDLVQILDLRLVTPVLWNLFPSVVISVAMITIRYEERPVLYSIVTLATVGLTTVAGIVAVVVLDLGVPGILWSNTLVSWVVCLFLFAFRRDETNFVFSTKYLREVLFYSAPITPARLGGWINDYIGRVLIAAVFSFALLGVYSIALKVALGVTLATNAFRLTWSPKANRYFEVEGTEGKFVEALQQYLVFFSLVVVGVVFISPAAVVILAPVEFRPAIAYVGLLAVAQMWNGSIDVLAAGNNWERKTYYNSIGSLISGGFTVVVLYLWLEIGGMLVASLALLGSAIVKAALIYATAQYNHPIPYPKVKILLSGAATTAYGLFCYYLYVELQLPLWQFSLLAGGVGLALVVLTEVFVAENDNFRALRAHLGTRFGSAGAQ